MAVSSLSVTLEPMISPDAGGQLPGLPGLTVLPCPRTAQAACGAQGIGLQPEDAQ